MVRKSLFIFTCLFFIFSAFVPEDSIYIIPGKGIGQFECGKTNYGDMRKVYGKGEIRTIQCCLCRPPLSKTSSVSWPNKGIYADFGNKMEKVRRKFVLSEIIIFDNNNFKTREGIGIGSSRLEIEHAFGKPIESFSNQYENSTSLYQELSYEGIRFYFDSKPDHIKDLDSMNYPATRIQVWNPN